MFERHAGGERVILVALDFGDLDFAESVAELRLLAAGAGLEILGEVQGKRSRPDAALFVGSGKADEIAALVAATEADVVIFNHELSPAQERNLERRVHCRVVDRVTLILDIFARRAHSAEGKLQVELAQLQHLSTRLVRGWTHLERQRGGVGMRGPGEKQLETDRRLIGMRVKALRDRLAKLGKQRRTQRRSRARQHVLSVALVGYTNAGKSTLFNALTRAGTYAADQLFATLDTTTRKIYLPQVGEVVLSDTVGFITRLPHDLVAAFRATLEATAEADLLLHVIDSASPGRERQIEAVDKVLAEIGADAVPQLRVYNKLDLTGVAPGVGRDEYGKLQSVYVSAQSGAGLELLRDALSEILVAERVRDEASASDEDTSQSTAFSA
ncbi:MAG: GTPase HflX [Thiobacillus sp. SCN 63-374]|uniref:GTPase HflX n=1 Tax=unclassified Thiobacillus TaxID=2646513 RepID=UPI00086F3EFD|nr:MULTISPECIES: GTPase HflX [unclassified Thiobacillus]MBS0330957.1 GTPase HflX [Pseudomonadota bacterium]ODU48511.1 MAG: GTPase HflX [Thiobacillus sp. SCN 63-374]ODV01919.1 MAG: GTPase HflX [Thiobacillus sp. SCN 63-57]OJY56171.1 MAG: GTPase HflX [Thiobacillus sp. 0-1251]